MINKSSKRRDSIIQLLQEQKFCSIKYLMDTLAVSESTIKRDLNELEIKGDLKRTHGGAFFQGVPSRIDTFVLRKSRNILEKNAIAVEAAKLIKDDQRIFLDAGTTIGILVNHINAKRVSVNTNNVYILDQSIDEDYDFKVYVIPGELRPHQALILGEAAVKEIENSFYDSVFLSSAYFDIERGLLTESYEEFLYKKALVKNGKNIIVCCDSSKINNWNQEIETVPLEKIDYLITDKKLSASIRKQLEKNGLMVILVDI